MRGLIYQLLPADSYLQNTFNTASSILLCLAWPMGSNLRPAHAEPDAVSGISPIAALAAEYPNDVGISGDPDVVFADDFESWKSAGTEPPSEGWSVRRNKTSRTRVVPGRVEMGGSPGFGERILEVACWTEGRGSQVGGLSLKLGNYDHANEGLGDGYDDLYIRYYIKFDQDYRGVRNHGANLGGRDVTREDAAWVGMAGIRDVSTRGYFYSGVQPYGQRGAIEFEMGFYSYHLDKKGPWGENYLVRNRIPISVGTWHCVERHMKLNSVDPDVADGRHDGVEELWIDGQLSIRNPSVRFRRVGHLNITLFCLETYYHGLPEEYGTNHPIKVYFDNVVIAKRYIGPAVTAPPKMRGTTSEPDVTRAGTYVMSGQMSRDGRCGVGKGIFVTLAGNRMGVPDEVKHNPHAAGVQAGITWAQLEPKKGQYAWDQIDRFLAELDAHGKKGAFKFVGASGKVMSDAQLARGKGRAGHDVIYENTGTPQWLWEDPEVERLGGIATKKGRLPYYPVFWDAAYQKHLEDFIEAFASRYDGDRRIEYIRMGGWQIGTNEPSFYGGASEFIIGQLAQYGMDTEGLRDKRKVSRLLSGRSLYAVAVKDMIDIWYKHFRQTRLGATIHFSKEEGSFEEEMMKYCFNMKTTILNTGLNEKDKSEARGQYRAAHDEYGCKVGWGGVTHIGQFLTEEELASKGRTVRFEALMQGIGDDNDPVYAPASKVSYLVFGIDFLRDRKAVEWAWGRLAQ